jgi:hypothetical protein
LAVGDRERGERSVECEEEGDEQGRGREISRSVVEMRGTSESWGQGRGIGFGSGTGDVFSTPFSSVSRLRLENRNGGIFSVPCVFFKFNCFL